MILKGGARSSGAFFSKHLLKAEDNERVSVVEIRGLLADTVPEAFQEMRMVAAGTKADNYFYHLSINPREDEQLTPDQWERATDVAEEHLGLTDQPRMVIEHEKHGRVHRHIVWSRVDIDSMTVIPANNNYLAHDHTRLQLEQEFSHEPTPPTPEPALRKSREIADWENFRAAESGIDPKEMKAEITQLWQQSDGGRAFQAAIEEKGYLLAKGDRRDFVLIDPEGDVHSLARRIDGAKAADIRAKMGDLDRDSLMSAKEASAWMKAEADNESGGQGAVTSWQQHEEPEHWLNPKLAVLEKFAHDHPALAPPATYGVVRSAQEFAEMSVAQLRAREGELPFESERHAWDILRARTIDAPHAPEKVEDKSSDFWQEWISRLPERQPEQDEPELER